MTDLDTDRFDRNIRAFGTDGQQTLADTHIVMVGAGGLGSCTIEQFARIGVRDLTVIDPDIVEESNLPRLYGADTDDIGRPKVAVAADHIQPLTSVNTVTTVQKPVEDATDTLKQADIIVAGVDQISTRIWLNQFAVRHELPYIDSGVVITADNGIEQMEGYIQRIVPGVTACYDCLNRGDRERARIERLSPEAREQELADGYIDESDLTPEPAVIPLNTLVAGKTVLVAVKHLTGYDPADFIRYEDMTNTLEVAQSPPSDRCATCGQNGVLGRGEDTGTETDTDYSHLDLDTDQL